MVDSTKGVKPSTVYDSFKYDASAPDVQKPVINTGVVNPVPKGKLGSIEPTNDMAVDKIAPVTTTPLDAIRANVFRTAQDWYSSYEEDAKFDPQPNYDPKPVADEWFKEYDRLNEHEGEYLYSANSPQALAYRMDRLREERSNQAVTRDHPMAGAVGSLIDVDLLTLFVPVVGEATWAKRGYTAAGAAGIAAGTNAVLGHNSIRTDTEQNMDAVVFGMGGLFGGFKVGSKAGQTTAAEAALEAAPEVVAPVIPKPRMRVSSDGAVVNAADIPKPRMRLYAGIDQAVIDIQTESASLAAKSGGVQGTVNVMGVPLSIPISRPVRPDMFKLPDGVKGFTDPVTNLMESTAETVFRLTNGDMTNPLNKMLASSRTQGDNAAYAAAAIEGDLSARLIKFEDVMDSTVSKLYNTSPITGRADHIAAQQNLMSIVQRDLQIVDSRIRDLTKAGVHVDENVIQRLLKDTQPNDDIVEVAMTYVRSGFAESAYDYMKHAGLMSEELVQTLPRRATYTPLRHSYERMSALLRNGVASDTLFTFLGDQIMRRYPTLAGEGFRLTPNQLGMHFYTTLEKAETNIADIVTSGISSDAMRKLLSSANLDHATIEKVVERFSAASKQNGANTVSNLRSRMDWDWTASIQDFKTGRIFGMSDIVDNDLALTLNDYVRNTAKRVGAARYGLSTPSEIDASLAAMVELRPKNVSFEMAQNFAKNVKAQIIGGRTGEYIAPAVRSLNTIVSSTKLGGAGIWGMMELTQQVFHVGMLRSLPHIKVGLSHAFTALQGATKSDADALYGILTQRLSAEGRWRKWGMRYQDNFEVTKGIHERINFFGQSQRFTNGSEYIKRFQVGVVGGVLVSAFEGVAKGSTKDIKYLRDTFKMSNELIDAIKTQYGKHGGDIDSWEMGARTAMEQKVFFEVDNMAMTLRSGEIPRWMEHSSVGKTIAPFMSFAMAMQEKVLLHSARRDGMAGVAMAIATQLPTAVMIAAAQNVRKGENWDHKLATTSVQAMSIMGSWGVLGGIVANGGYRSGATMFSPFNDVIGMGNKLASKDQEVTLRDWKNITPVVGATTALDFVLSIYESAND